MKVLILCGGNSTERDISLQTGESIHKILSSVGHEVYILDTIKVKLSSLKKEEWDFAFIALHGKGGEDGVAQAILGEIGIPYSGCGVAASAIAMKKNLAKIIWKYNNLNTPDFIVVKKDYDLDEIKIIKFPCIVKPNENGCSFGLSLVKEMKDIFFAIDKAFIYSDSVIIEEFINGREFTVPILNNKYLNPVEIVPENEIFDYQSKFESKTTKRILKPDLHNDELQVIGECALNAFNSIGCQIYGRVDLIYCTRKKEPFLLEINTIPGMTYASVFLESAKESGLKKEDVLNTIISESSLLNR